MVVKGITIHNTGNTLSASSLYQILKKEGHLNYCHYLIDENEIIETLPVEMESHHTGKGYDFGNRFTIAIEICRSQCNESLYLKAQKRAIDFIKELLEKYNLSKDDIYFHIDFNEQAKCPHRILELYKNKEEFINGNFI